MLEPKSETFFLLNYNDVEKLVSDNYFNGEEYGFLYQEECSNDTYMVFHVGSTPYADWDEYDLKGFTERKKEYMTHTYMDALCTDGVIPAGKYLVNISW